MSTTIPFGKPMIGPEEMAAVNKVMEGPILVHGPMARNFETEFATYTSAPHAVSVSSCTAGMHLVYFAMGIGPGDEVIVPAQTHIATAHAVELTGAKAVFVDADATTGNLQVEGIEEAVTENTKALAVVHYLGVPVEMEKVLEVAARYDLRVLEDCALSLGAYLKGTHTGLHGDAGVFSFYPVKHITTAEGGMVIMKDASLAKRVRLTKAFGVDRSHDQRSIPGMYDAPELGFNYRMSEIHAAIGLEQIRKFPGFLEKRKRNFSILSGLLGTIEGISVLPQPESADARSAYYCLAALLSESLAPRRADIMKCLSDRGIGSSIYYPHPVPRMTWYRQKYGYDEAAFAAAARISDTMIALPVGPHLGESEMIKIADALKDTVSGVDK